MAKARSFLFSAAVHAVFLLLAAGQSHDRDKENTEVCFKILKNIPLQLVEECSVINGSHIKFFLHDPARKADKELILLSNNNANCVDNTRETKVLIHGCKDHPSTEMLKSYVQKGDCNVIVVDWTVFSILPYELVYCYAPQVGEEIAKFIYNIGLDLNNTHILGQSMGAQLAGFVGQHIQVLTDGLKVKRITALDAINVGYGFPPVGPNKRLSPDDAYFVDAIHTDCSGFGYCEPYGTVDFYVNDGMVQPGCPILDIPDQIEGFEDVIIAFKCSHKRSFRYFNESIFSDNFIATGPPICVGSSCTPSKVVMGENCPTNITGRYDITTRSEPPYAL